MADTDIELLARCGEFALQHIHSVENRLHNALETSGATRLVMGLRLCRLQRAVVAVGMFSIFESMLQTAMNWHSKQYALVELDKYLRNRGENDLADRARSYKNAIDALKHGSGNSYNKLAGAQNLEFEVKGNQGFFFEGDVSEVGVLVDADDAFLRLGATLIGEVCAVIEVKEGTRV